MPDFHFLVLLQVQVQVQVQVQQALQRTPICFHPQQHLHPRCHPSSAPVRNLERNIWGHHQDHSINPLSRARVQVQVQGISNVKIHLHPHLHPHQQALCSLIYEKNWQKYPTLQACSVSSIVLSCRLWLWYFPSLALVHLQLRPIGFTSWDILWRCSLYYQWVDSLRLWTTYHLKVCSYSPSQQQDYPSYTQPMAATQHHSSLVSHMTSHVNCTVGLYCIGQWI